MPYEITVGRSSTASPDNTPGPYKKPGSLTGWLSRVKTVVLAILFLSLAVGVLLAAFMLGIVIAGLILMGIIAAGIVFWASRLWQRRRGPRQPSHHA